MSSKKSSSKGASSPPSSSSGGPPSSASSVFVPSSSHGLFGYLESLPRSQLLRMYESPDCGHFACRAVLQRLPELARQYAMRLTEREFPADFAELWTTGGRTARREARRAVERMEKMCVIEPIGTGGVDGEGEVEDGSGEGNGGEGKKEKSRVLHLTAEFRDGLQKSLTSLQSAPWPFITADQAAQLKAEAIAMERAEGGEDYTPPPTPDQLEMYTQRRLDSILHFLVGSSPLDVEDPPGAVVGFVEETGLMQEDPEWQPMKRSRDERPPLVITSKGYKFMLQDVHVQVWQFVLQYFKSLECDEKRTEALLFLIGLSFCHVGRAYPTGALSEILLQDFSHFGLLYVCKIGTITAFYPTRVAVNLVVGSLAEAADKSGWQSSASASRGLESSLLAPVPPRSQLAVIVQTDFRLCAYTASELHVSMLGLFCDVSNFVRFPNVVFFRITRDSVKGAFKLGIEAGQILRFLRMHAHPRLRTGDQPLLPKNVEDQILLWDQERTRVLMEEVYMLQCGGEEYRAAEQFASDVGAFAWGAEEKNRMYVLYDKAESVLAFVRQWRARQAQGAEQGGVGGVGSNGGGKVKRPATVHRQGSYT